MEEALTILLQYGGRAIADISKRFKEMLCLLVDNLGYPYI